MSVNQQYNHNSERTCKDMRVNKAAGTSEYGDLESIRLPAPRIHRDMRMPSGMGTGAGMPLAPQMPSGMQSGMGTGVHMPLAPQMPSGTPGMPSDRMPTGVGMPLMPPMAPTPAMGEAPSTVQSPFYTAGFLRNFIGRNMRVEFLIGTSGALVDRMGVLVEVGASYIVLRPLLTDDLLMCDLYSIKFVTIFD